MADKIFSGKVLNVCNTTAQWATITQIIPKGLLCVEFTPDERTLVKLGDGINQYNVLPYISDGTFDIADYYTSEQTDALIESKISTLGTIVRVKGVKASISELPTEGNIVGDLWFVGTIEEGTQDSYSEYIWTTDSVWEFIGKSAGGDLSEYAKITYVDGKYEALDTRLTAVEEKAHTHENKAILDETTAPFTTELAAKLEDFDTSKFVTTDDTITINCQL